MFYARVRLTEKRGRRKIDFLGGLFDHNDQTHERDVYAGQAKLWTLVDPPRDLLSL